MKEAFEQSSSGDLDDGNWVWKEAVYGEKRIDFYLEDDTGRIRIDMESADIFGMPKTVFSIEYDKIRKALRFPKGPMDAETEFFCKLLDSRTKELLLGSGRFKELKFKEFSLSDQGELYVVGYADFYQPQESDQIRDEKELIIKNAIYVSDVPRGIHIGKLRVQMGIGYFFGSLFFISGALIVLTSWGFF
ncbi:MAG: hypothetical protein GY729_17355 [Desulfobacteraceae bacterium]|nr:hypothetical protein [Desulfobacteraceae bacterium]